MKYSVNDFVGPIKAVQREWLNDVLQPGEEIRWATRPKVVFWTVDTVDSALITFIMLVFGGTAAVGVVLNIIEKWGATQWPEWSVVLGWLAIIVDIVVRLLVLAFALVLTFLGLCGLFGVATVRRDKRLTLYVLTNKRALTFYPAGYDEYSLDADMVLRREQGREGESLIFRIDAEGNTLGWKGLHDSRVAEHMIREALKSN